MSSNRMPKRKAFEPVDSSDGDDDDYRQSYMNRSSNKKYSSSVSVSSTTFNFGGLGGNSILQSNLAKPGGSNSNSTLHSSNSILQSNLAKPAPKPSVSGPSSNSSPVAVKKPKKAEFSKRMKHLNQAFITACRSTTGANPSHSLVPIVRDYLYHSRVVMEESRESPTGDRNVPEAANGVSTSSSSRSFRSLGEFFEDFETRYVQTPRASSSTSASTSKEASVKQTTESSPFNSKALREISTPSGSNFINSNTPTPTPTPTPVFPSSSTSTPVVERSSFHSFNTLVKAADQSKIISAAESTVSIEPSMFPSTYKPTPAPAPTPSPTPAPAPVSRSPPKHGLPSCNRPSTTSHYLRSIPPPLPPPVVPLKTSDFLANPGRIPMPLPVLRQTAAFTGFSFFTNPMPSASAYGAGVPTISSSQPEQTNSGDADDEDDDEPPKSELVPVTEDDAVYSIRCKVFGVIDGKYKDKGVGVLYIKKIEEGKHQVVVRADNNLGTVILNILLQKSLPVDKKSAKDVMTMDFLGNNKKGMPILLRTKSEKDANELHNKLKEFQRKTSS